MIGIKNKQGASSWSIGKLLSIVLVVIIVILLIYGFSSGSVYKLYDSLEGFYNNVAYYFAGYNPDDYEGGEGAYTISAVILDKERDVLVDTQGYCSVNIEEFGKRYALNPTDYLVVLEGGGWKSVDSLSLNSNEVLLGDIRYALENYIYDWNLDFEYNGKKYSLDVFFDPNPTVIFSENMKYYTYAYEQDSKRKCLFTNDGSNSKICNVSKMNDLQKRIYYSFLEPKKILFNGKEYQVMYGKGFYNFGEQAETMVLFSYDFPEEILTTSLNNPSQNEILYSSKNIGDSLLFGLGYHDTNGDNYPTFYINDTQNLRYFVFSNIDEGSNNFPPRVDVSVYNSLEPQGLDRTEAPLAHITRQKQLDRNYYLYLSSKEWSRRKKYSQLKQDLLKACPN